jgi:hypothetical protein
MGYKFEIETTMISSLADYASGLDLVTVMFQDTPLRFQNRNRMSVYELNGDITALLNSRGQGGYFTLEADESEFVDPNKVYVVRLQPPRKFSVFIRQLSWEVEENENWMRVSAELGDAMGLPKWCQLSNSNTVQAML